MFLQLPPLLLFFLAPFLRVAGLGGGVPLTPGEIQLTGYGAGILPVDGEDTCVCVWMPSESACIYAMGEIVTQCYSYYNDDTKPPVWIMGKEYKPTQVTQRLDCGNNQNFWFVKIQQPYPPSSVHPTFLSPGTTPLVPPTGSYCQIIGFNVKGGKHEPSKLEVQVTDFVECKADWEAREPANAANMKADRHFCVDTSQVEGTIIEEEDEGATVYCSPWTDEKKRFWWFGKDKDEDEDEEEEVSRGSLVFSGFISMYTRFHPKFYVVAAFDCPAEG